MLYPAEFVRLVASLITREPEAAITPVVMERMSDAQLDALIAQCIEDGLDPAATRVDHSVDGRASRRT
jgi:hypothetical protein